MQPGAPDTPQTPDHGAIYTEGFPTVAEIGRAHLSITRGQRSVVYAYGGTFVLFFFHVVAIAWLAQGFAAWRGGSSVVVILLPLAVLCYLLFLDYAYYLQGFIVGSWLHRKLGDRLSKYRWCLSERGVRQEEPDATTDLTWDAASGYLLRRHAVILKMGVTAQHHVFTRRMLGSDEDWIRLRWLVYRQLGLCPKCGYTLRGLTSETCPECGHALDTPTHAQGDRAKS
ncbi:MAG: hypothetical protein AAF823_09165 [Planctomycetota bacterium]